MNTELANTYQNLKEQEKLLKAQLADASARVNAAFDAGEDVVTSDGTRYIREIAGRDSFKVSGIGGFLALIRNHKLDPARFLSVKAAEVKKLDPELRKGLEFITKPINRIVVGK